jgi:hypothetical protein
MAWNYSNTSVQTTITAPVAPGDSSITIGDTTGLPVTFPFSLILDYQQASVEVVTVTNLVGLTLTVTRGQDGTSAQTHSVGAPVVHGVVARDVAEPQAHIAATSNVHGVGASSAVVGTATTQTLTNKIMDGNQNTFTNIGTASITSIDAAKVTQPFTLLNVITPTLSTVGLSILANQAARSQPVMLVVAQNNSISIDEDGVLDLDRGDLSINTSRGHGAAAVPARAYIKATGKKGFVVQKDQAADLFDLQNWTADDGTIWSRVDSLGGLFSRKLVARPQLGDTADLAQFMDSSGAVLAKVDNTGSITANNLTISGTFNKAVKKIWTVTSTSATGNISGETVFATGTSSTYTANSAYRIKVRALVRANGSTGQATFQIRDTNVAGTLRGGPLRVPALQTSGSGDLSYIEHIVANTSGTDITSRVLCLTLQTLGPTSVLLNAAPEAPWYVSCEYIGASADYPEAVAL